MASFQRILFPVDFSEACRATAPYVRDAVRQFSASLILVHASGTEDGRLQEFASEMFPVPRVECIARPGKLSRIIREAALHLGADMAMMPAGSPSWLRHRSTTAGLLRDARIAVWSGVESTPVECRSNVPYQSILCAMENGREGEEILKAAVVFAGSYGARLSLVTVVESSLEFDFSPYKQEFIDAADHRLREMKCRLDVDAPHVVIDSPATPYGIRQEALLKKADLVIVGRGRSQNGFSRIWSQLNAIVRDSPCPVLSLAIPKA